MKQNRKGHLYDLERIARRAMLERGLYPDYSPEAAAELHRLRKSAAPGSAVRDLRALPWLSIDNDTSMDLDQLTAAEPLGKGEVKILVAVADVDALVSKACAIDSHANHNTTSVYTPARIFSMLPERLSTDLTSLNEHQDRLAVIVEMVFDENGLLLESDVYHGHVRNKGKLAYNSVAAWLEESAPAPAPIAGDPSLQEQIRIQDRIARKLRHHRHTRGALTLQVLEAEPVMDNGVIKDFQLESKNRAHELIEDIMIAANSVVAEYLERKGIPSLRRILRSPQRWDRIVELAAGLNESLPAEPDAVSLERFLLRRRKVDPESFPDLSLAVVKLIGAGEYAVESPGHRNPGHFGLAVASYTHSTAPNRRYPDLITQRLVKASWNGEGTPYKKEELEKLALHCTQMEGAANKVERQVRKSAAALFMASRIGDHFNAIVTGASEKGTWVRVLQPPVEGKLMDGFPDLDVGDRLRVELLAADVERGYIDFSAA